MQQTRRFILEILRECGEATVDELVGELKKRIQHNITAVTVRHHLDILRSDNLVTAPAVRRSGAPGRPQYVYSLTDKALEQFPNNYQRLIGIIVEQLKNRMPTSEVNVIFEGVADQMIAESTLSQVALESIPFEVRLEHAITYLNDHGYSATYEACDEGFILRTHNCPYHRVSHEHRELCGMDMRLISGLLGVVPRTMQRISDDADTCAYMLPTNHRQPQLHS